MINIVFFGKYREQFGASALAFPLPVMPPPNQDLSWDSHQLIAAVRAAHPANTAFLDDPALVCAVNRVVASTAIALKAGDEVAFYPPVTGG